MERLRESKTATEALDLEIRKLRSEACSGDVLDNMEEDHLVKDVENLKGEIKHLRSEIGRVKNGAKRKQNNLKLGIVNLSQTKELSMDIILRIT